ncbi:bifunctional 3-demethylubiquinone-9 3-methyltransferase/ 2-octaprenyl-6-hydroxy phenol methylase [compost metagenome]|uniref:class I SAM-dependent methyltransferase n=1 Tax=Achromobacter sp. Root83 TaxID=1736602 RepID=UPI00070DE0E1|nr:class I SAM-dependent methyltransferase [Achromobacter sp. Root83]KRC77775.1 SAM-dependent methyltransferase [Achromobacter sp. Root83]
MKQDLNAVSSEYRPNGATEIENNLMLNWYPHRIINRSGHSDSLLELGLGHGYTSRIFAQACNRHVIVDGASVVIEQFRQNTPGFAGEIVEAYFEDYVPDQQFDIIVMGFILEHVDDPDLILDRYRGFLKPGGKMYVAVPNAKSMNRRLGLELGLIDDIYSLNANDIALGHQRQYCRDTLTAAVRRAGYRITHEEGIYLKPLPLAVLKSLDDFDANLQAMLKVGVDFPDLCVALLMELEEL